MKSNLFAFVVLCLSGGLLYAAERPGVAPPKGPILPKKPPLAAVPDELRQRIDALNAFREKGPPSPADLAKLISELKNASPLVRAHAAQILGQLGAAGKPAVSELVALVADPDPVVRREASRAVLSIRPGPAVTIPLAKRLLADADPAVRTRILNTLADFGKEALPGLIAAIQDADVAPFACLVLGEIGPDAAEAVPALLARLQTEERPEVRQQIILALASIRSAEAVPALTAVVQDAQHPARVPAMFALGMIGPPAATAKSAIAQGLVDADPVLKTVSAWATVKIWPDQEAVKDRCVTLIAESLLDKNPLARRAAFRALADLRPGPQRVLPALKHVLQSADPAAVTEALDVLAEVGEPAVPALIEALKLAEHRALVASIVGRIGPAAKDAVPALIDVLKTDNNPESQREALLALGGIGPASAPAAPAATAALAATDERVVLAACYALSKIGPAAKAAVPALQKLSKDEDETLREYATKALAAIGQP